jgi:hypothetical protein
MVRKALTTVLKTGGLAFLLLALLFGGWSGWASVNFVGPVLSELMAVLRDAGTQWMVFLCLAIYFIALGFFRRRSEGGFPARRRRAATIYWLVYPLGISAGGYALYYCASVPALTLLAGAVLGQGVAAGVTFGNGGQAVAVASEGRGSNRSPWFLDYAFQIPWLLVLLLAGASVWHGDSGPTYAYQAHTRWTGAWDNPNLFGLLMGTGVVLVIGGMASLYRFSTGRRAAGKGGMVLTCLGGLLGLAAALLLGRGWLHSYSRGAWIATGFGFVFLVWRTVRNRRVDAAAGEGNLSGSARPRHRPGSVWWPVAVMLASVWGLGFWQFRQAEWHPVRRALSAVNPVDFSWRNRVAAWEGDWQMMAERPWFGAGWNQPEPLYEHYYLSPKLTESAAIQMNDYLLLGATLGVPALFGFGMYWWRTLGREGAGRGARGAGSEGQKAGKRETGTIQSLVTSAATGLNDDLLSATCHAGAMVLLVGFWFDGGLFKLPTAATFWILLELGAAQRNLTAKNA